VRGTLKGEYVGEVVSRLRPIRDFVESANKGVFINLNHPIIQRFIDFVGPEAERVIKDVFERRGWVDKEGAREVIDKLRPTIQKRVNEEIEAARYLVAVRHHVDEVIKEFTGELGIDKRLSELEGRLSELEGFVRKVIASEFPIPKDRVAKPELFGKYEEVGGRIIIKEPFSRELRLDWQLPKEILSDEELSRIASLWVIHHYADRFHGWLARKPGDAIYYNSVYSGWVPGAVVLSALHSLGIGISRLNWSGLLDDLERLDEEMSRVRAQLKEARDEATKNRLTEELSRLKSEREAVQRALFTWADAIEALKLALPKEEWESIYEKLPGKLKVYVDLARDPRNSFESFLKGSGLKIGDGLRILAILDREKRREGRRLSVDEVKEAVELLRNHLPMLDRLIEPTMAELIDVVTKRARALDGLLKAGSIKDTERSAKAARKMLEQALKELEGGDIDNATNHLKKAIRHLRRITEEREELARDAGKLDTLVKQLEALNALMRLARG